MENTQDWESLIASRMRPAEHSAELLQREREREREPKRKAQHRAWAKTEAGKVIAELLTIAEKFKEAK